ncbi:nitrate- and nitrite sensing domain-containing protein [Streptomyces sp. PTM05]|uniref:histidine kinase n=1 Tax=Streptantibioticus parmotrematis TaxID=2873249 RepID=A0ABS7QU12_9ACTN|nr:nitrate- and nitrite sensing domain-containing protein [Streptantibioticus parmotrematis]MBY8886688.1 nitrate- and nitrite sensing domain-containing protein [Streptantibioticus parmotrematis]
MLLLVLVPLIAIIPLAGVRVVTDLGTLRAVGDLRDQALLAQRISTLVNQVGEERDLTEVALTGSGVHGDASLARAQQATDTAAGALTTALDRYHRGVADLPPATRQLGDRAEARLGDLAPLRASVVRLGTVAPAFTAYTTIIDDLMDFGDQLSVNTTDHTLGNLVATLANVEQAEEQTSVERGYLVGVLRSGGFTLEQKQELEQAQAQFTSAYDAIANDAPAGIVNLYQSTVSGNEIGAADGTLQAVTDAAQEGTPLSSLGTGEQSAYQAMTVKVNAIRSIQARVIAAMTQRASHLLDAGRKELYENVAIIVAVVLLSLLGATVLARSVVRPLRALRGSALEIADQRLPDVVRRLGDARFADPGEAEDLMRVRPIGVRSRDEVGQVARAFDRVHSEAVRLAAEQAMMRGNVNAMFTNLSRRSESLVQRQLRLIDELEGGEQNPGRLESLFKLDHLATRMRRNNENLLVLAGEEQGRRWNRPVLLLDVVRAATAEVEQYERVTVTELPDIALAGHAATDVVHLIAELIENAAEFSAPDTEVVVGATTLGYGAVLVEITDAGLGMSPEELAEVNERLAEPPVVDVSISRRMGLFVVGRLASKYRVRVGLERAATGGVSALVTLPMSLLKAASEVDSDAGTAFDLAMRPGTYDAPTGLSGMLGGERAHPQQALGEQAFTERAFTEEAFPDEPEDDAAFERLVREHRGAPAREGFGWFHEEEPETPEPQNAYPGADFTWFEEQPQGTEPDGVHAFTDPPPPPSQPPSAPPSAGQPAPRLPIFEAIESEWYGHEQQGGAPLPRRRPGHGVPPEHSRPAQPPAQPPQAFDAGRPQLPRRVRGIPPAQRQQMAPPARAPRPQPQPLRSAEAAERLKQRLSNFRQGVRHGLDETGGGRGTGAGPGESDAR